MSISLTLITNPSPTSKASFQVNGFGGAKLIRAKEMHHLGIIHVDQGGDILNAECPQMIEEFLNQLLADTLMLVIGIDADGIRGMPLGDSVISHQSPP